MRILSLVLVVALVAGCTEDAPKPTPKKVAAVKAPEPKRVGKVNEELTKEDMHSPRWIAIYKEEMQNDPSMALLRTNGRYIKERNAK